MEFRNFSLNFLNLRRSSVVNVTSAILYVVALIISISDCVNCLEQNIVRRSRTHSDETIAKSPCEKFWECVQEQQHVSKLNSSSDLINFNEKHSDTFVMFYASWCKSSIQAKGEFAKAAQEIAYTEGYSHIHFGALDCSASGESKMVCNKTYNITRYPRFIYFKNGQQDRMYTVKCPRHTDFFYNWIVHEGNENFCSGSGSEFLAMATSSSSGLIMDNMQYSSPIFCVILFVLLSAFTNNFGLHTKIKCHL